jgi:cytochrome oxidase Cu insertion factor (SCO1/SenC/PrrC family)
LFTGAVDDPNSLQLHDFEPGIAPSGLFWTIPFPPGQIDADPISGRARMRGVQVAVADYHDFFSAIAPNPSSIPSRVSFDVSWLGGGVKQTFRDDQVGFVGTYVPGPTSVSFTASNDHSGVVYTSDPDGQFNPTFDQLGAGSPAVGYERNGKFFS